MVRKMIVEEISASEYEVGIINSIAEKEGAFRQRSKAPTFRFNLSGHLHNPHEELRLQRAGGEAD